MTIFPAIDLKDGKAVRLTKGLMDTAKIYSDEPSELAKRFEDMGLVYLHIVDLNGAFAGEPKNLKVIEKIANSTKLTLQLGGGIRDEETIKRYENIGISRVILGSIALKDPEFVKSVSKLHRVVVGIDAKDGFVAVDGWAELSSVKATELASEFANAGVEAIICTDISKDGTLSGVNVEFTESIAVASGLETIASGGVSTIEDIVKCKQNAHIAGVIVGKAYYEGKVNLEEAVEIAR